MSRNVRGLVLFPSFLLLFLFLLAAPTAHAVQTGGSISLYPTDWGRLHDGDLVDVVVTLNNTSTDTPATDAPADGVAPVPAQLSGIVTVFLALGGPDGMTFVPGVLKFVPVGGSGCVAQNGNVLGCTASGTDSVDIKLKPAGITLPANGSVDVATIRIQVLNAQIAPELGLKGMTEPGALHACSSSTPSVCADCEATGCTTLIFTADTVKGCPHPCPARIIFRGDMATPDFFEFHGLIKLTTPLSSPSPAFAVSLSNTAQIFSFSIPAGGLKEEGSGVFTFNDNNARTVGGIGFVKIAQRDGMPDVYKIDIQAFDASLESKATVPNMTVKFSLGSDVFQTTNDWTQKPNGWFLNLPR
jgi:hypothetical protein